VIIELMLEAEETGRKILAAIEGEYRTAHALVMHGRRFIVVSGDKSGLDWEAQLARPGVIGASAPDETAYFARRAFSPHDRTRWPIGSQLLGGPDLVVIAGPCAVENEEDLLDTARSVKAAGAHALRAGAFKPRTSPYNFQGLRMEGLERLARVSRAAGLPTVSEILDPETVEAASELIDVIQIGTRNMTNQALLKRVGRSQRPVLIKRGFASPLEELIRAAEFVMAEGNAQVALCERGIQTFEKATRFTLDVAAPSVLKEMTHLPIVVDPSHAAGRRELVKPLALAAAVAGADALLVEVHVAPERTIKPGDGAQALHPSEFASLMRDLDKVLIAVGRRLAPALGRVAAVGAPLSPASSAA
jgi:3-deoxy-7-phosphoheptulonate synthase